MTEVAFATYRGFPGLAEDDRLAADALRAADVWVTAVPWDAAGVDWSRFSSVVIRSTWDYHLKPAGYAAWLRSFVGSGRLWNPPDAVLENLDKRYLIALAGRGVEVVPTVYRAAGDGPTLREVLERNQWSEAVVKPAVSASAYGTWLTSLAKADADQQQFVRHVQSRAVLVQHFLPEVVSGGEWSLVFLGGRYSHAVLKRPAAADFRVQSEFGGTAVAAEPSPALIEQARAVLAEVGHPLLYARVDGVQCGGRFVLMELEINEPHLFFGLSDGAARQFAEAIRDVLL